jgi:hypothetical protein
MRDQWGHVERPPSNSASNHFTTEAGPRRRIARELGVDREAVGRYLLLAKPAISTPGKGIGRKSSEPLAKAPARALALDRRAIPERR